MSGGEKKAAIFADNYKLKTFRRNLKNAGFEWEENPFSNNTMTLIVSFKPEDFAALERVVRESNSQAKGSQE